MRTRKLRKRVTLGIKGDIRFNGAMFEALGRPTAIELLFDELNKTIGLRPGSLDMPHACPVPRFGTRNFYRVSAGRFCKHFGIRIPCLLEFEDAFIDSDGVLMLSLKKAFPVPGAKWDDDVPDHLKPPQP